MSKYCCQFVPDHLLDSLSLPKRKPLQFTRGFMAGLQQNLFRRKVDLPPHTKDRSVFSMRNTEGKLPGSLAISDRNGQTRLHDATSAEAFDYSGDVWDFWKQVAGRESLDNKNSEIISSVHYGKGYNNAYFNGEQMVYGDGDGKFFLPFTKSLDVIGHELGHWCVQSGPNLVYWFESGALNEHFADVFGTCAKHHANNTTIDKADWLIGPEIVGPDFPGKAIRSFKDEFAYEGDPQPKHMKDMYRGMQDNGGVHINSGIPNHMFYHVCLDLGGYSYEAPFKIWFATMMRLKSISGFYWFARIAVSEAEKMYGKNSREHQAVLNAAREVGILK